MVEKQQAYLNKASIDLEAAIRKRREELKEGSNTEISEQLSKLNDVLENSLESMGNIDSVIKYKAVQHRIKRGSYFKDFLNKNNFYAETEKDKKQTALVAGISLAVVAVTATAMFFMKKR